MAPLGRRPGRPVGRRPARLLLGAVLGVALVAAVGVALGVSQIALGGTARARATRAPVPSRTTPSTSPAPTATSATPTATAAPAPVHVVGIGDSVTAGTNCGCVDFVRRYAAKVSPAGGPPTTATNLGEGGLTSAQLLGQLRSPGPVRSAVAGADVVLVTIGANDLGPQLLQWNASGCSASCYQPMVDAVGGNVRAIVDAVRQLRAGRPVKVLVTDYWNVFEDGDVALANHGAAYVQWTDALTRSLNQAICHGTTAAGATCVDLYRPFKGSRGDVNPTALLAADGDHPNAAGHEVIARALVAAG